MTTFDTKNNPFTSSDYEERIERKRDAFEARADKAQANSEAYSQQSRQMAEAIPFGQPILVGHHSEGRDRRYRDKIHNTMGKSVSEHKKSEYYARRAASVGHAGIASDDPNAIPKLQEKLQNLIDSHELMKAMNKTLRRKNPREALKAMDLTDEQIDTFLEPDFAGRVGFASCSVQNSNAEIRRVKQRITELEKLRDSQPLEYTGEEFSVCVDEGRVCIEFFQGKPSDDARKVIKYYSFKWSRFRGAWVRKATLNAMCDAERLLADLKAMMSVY